MSAPTTRRLEIPFEPTAVGLFTALKTVQTSRVPAEAVISSIERYETHALHYHTDDPETHVEYEMVLEWPVEEDA